MYEPTALERMIERSDVDKVRALLTGGALEPGDRPLVEAPVLVEVVRPQRARRRASGFLGGHELATRKVETNSAIDSSVNLVGGS